MNCPGNYGILLTILQASAERAVEIMKILSTNIILYCKEWKDTVSFYQHLIDLPIITRNEWFVEFELTSISRLSVADESRTTVKSCEGQGITIGLQIVDILDIHTRYEKAGLRPTKIKEIWGSKAFYVFDPEGNRIEFWEDSAKS